MARFPDSRLSAPFAVFPDELLSSDFPGETRDTRRALAAYSGGTVWAFHPLL
jgi:hypothetical protein